MVAMDRIELRGMSFQGRHGVRPEERAQAQEFKVDIRVEAELTDAARSDLLEDTVDYRQIRSAAQDVIEGEPKKLLESMAGEDARRPPPRPPAGTPLVPGPHRPPGP